MTNDASHTEAAKMVYAPVGVKWKNTGEYIPIQEAAALGATNIRENPDIQSVGLVADWPQAYWR